MRNFDHPGMWFNVAQRADSWHRIQPALCLGEYAGARKQKYKDKEKCNTGFGIHQSVLKKLLARQLCYQVIMEYQHTSIKESWKSIKAMYQGVLSNMESNGIDANSKSWLQNIA